MRLIFDQIFSPKCFTRQCFLSSLILRRGAWVCGTQDLWDPRYWDLMEICVCRDLWLRCPEAGTLGLQDPLCVTHGPDAQGWRPWIHLTHCLRGSRVCGFSASVDPESGSRGGTVCFCRTVGQTVCAAGFCIAESDSERCTQKNAKLDTDMSFGPWERKARDASRVNPVCCPTLRNVFLL